MDSFGVFLDRAWRATDSFDKFSDRAWKSTDSISAFSDRVKYSFGMLLESAWIQQTHSTRSQITY